MIKKQGEYMGKYNEIMIQKCVTEIEKLRAEIKEEKEAWNEERRKEKKNGRRKKTTRKKNKSLGAERRKERKEK